MTTGTGSSTTLKGLARRAVQLMLTGPLRPPTLAGLRAAARTFPTWRPATALAFYAGDTLATEGRELVGRLRTGSDIHLLAADYMHRHIYFFGQYEPSTTRFLQSIATPGWTFLDVGANAGYFSLLAHDLGGSGSSIHAFEPNPRLADLLERSAASKPGIHVVRAACSDTTGPVDLHLSTTEGNTGLSTLRTDVLDRSAARIVVSAVTLDEYCQEHAIRPDLMKIDVEGHELDVLRGAGAVLASHTLRAVICEFAPERAEVNPLFELMAEHRYTPRSLGPAGELIPFTPGGLQNIVFVRA